MYTASAYKWRNAERGLTFIDLVMFIVIVGIAVAGVLLVMNYTSRHSGDPQLRKQALAIAESLLEEIELARFTYCNPSDVQSPYATAAVVGPIGPVPVRSSNAAGGCSAGMVENYAAVSGTRPYGNIINYVSAPGVATTYSLDANGSPIGGQTGAYTATVTIKQATLPGMTVDPGANSAIGSALLITVAVSYQGGANVVQLDGYRTQYAPQLMP